MLCWDCSDSIKSDSLVEDTLWNHLGLLILTRLAADDIDFTKVYNLIDTVSTKRFIHEIVRTFTLGF